MQCGRRKRPLIREGASGSGSARGWASLCSALLALTSLHAHGAPQGVASELAGLVQICRVPEPQRPASAFAVERGEPVRPAADYWLQDYWVSYACKEICDDWRECQVPAWDGGKTIPHERQADVPKQSVALVVDGMAARLAYTTDGGEKTLFGHGGGGGTAFGGMPLLEQRTDANIVVISWEDGFAPQDAPNAPPFPFAWGWYTRNGVDSERVPKLNRRVAAAMAWIHENLAGPGKFGTFGCSMGAQATFGAVLWHGLDEIVDYQALGGGPPLYDINAGCGRRSYQSGFCDLDATVACEQNADCDAVAGNSVCRLAETIPAAWAYESLINHVHATASCRMAEGGEPLPAFDESSMLAAEDGDWDIDHSIDLIVDVGGAYDPWRSMGGDEHWSLGHFMHAFNRMNMQPGSDKRWHAYSGANHCEAFGSAAVADMIARRMGL